MTRHADAMVAASYEDGPAEGSPEDNAVASLLDDNNRLRAALTLIAGFNGLTLIAPSMGPDADHGHQVGANKAFNQCADIAQSALTESACQK